MKKKYFTISKIVLLAMMAAIVCVVTFFRFPLLGSKVHFANAMCLLAGLLFGPLGGGLAAGLGSAIYDSMTYDFVQCMITFVSKFLMAAVCAWVARPKKAEIKHGRMILGCILGALTYVALYMLKTYIYQAFVYGYPMDTVWATMLSKLPASLINAVVAFVAAPIIYSALYPALKRAGLLEKLW